ncbi:3-oxoacyl-ACP synthase III family protein [Nubsella zeaxanthinifaciens]|uniref:3-oxoacyl-ACP synthase III family protein n=1 Tax=Nubsella zeaxanthinifaciens TaxID=392412 RepID=UPI002795C325|nr:ketoacyl-ACP synthase III [Nubsella zeaxanthinifaciens]
MNKIYSVITGTGSCIPTNVIAGKHFIEHSFFDGGVKIDKENEEIIQKFADITEINERRYIDDSQLNHDIGLIAAQRAIEDAGIDKESLDYILFCHNFGDVKLGSNRIDMLPALAAKVKLLLGINNPDCVAFDLIFGCPGWVQGMIQADYLIKSGDAKKVLVIGSETLSRIVDPHDRDSMIFADGAGATILEARETEEPTGILSHKTQTYASHAEMLTMGYSNNPYDSSGNAYIKMKGRKLYEFAVVTVPQLVKQAIDKSGIDVKRIKMVFIHQANGKMDHAIMKRLFKLYGEDTVPEKLVPMTISWLGNSSVATVPTLIDLVLKNKIDGYQINNGDYAVFASVGAGMHINAIVYKF